MYLRRVMKHIFLMMVVVTNLLWLTLSHAGGLPVFDGFNWAENAVIAKKSAESLLNQAEQIKHQLAMIENQKAQLKALSQYRWRDASHLLKALDSIQQQNEALSYGIKNWQQQFHDLYDDFGKTNQALVNRFNAVQKQQQATMGSIQNALGISHLSASGARDEEALLQTINYQAGHATNALQVAQAQTALQTENVQQLLIVKRLLLAQMNVQEAALASDVSQQRYQDETVQKMINSLPTEFPAYRDNPKFGKISMK